MLEGTIEVDGKQFVFMPQTAYAGKAPLPHDKLKDIIIKRFDPLLTGNPRWEDAKGLLDKIKSISIESDKVTVKK